MKPALYLCGKINRHDWRHDLIPGLRGHRHETGPLECDAYRYCGPFFENCDHGCAHGPGSHGVLGEPGLGCEEFQRTTQHRVWQRNSAALRSATCVFAYLQANDAFGSLMELGAAQVLRTPSWILFGPGVDVEQLWYAAQGAVDLRRRGAFTARDVRREDLPAHFKSFLQRFTR